MIWAIVMALVAGGDPGFLHEEEAWRARRIERLKSDEGWLTLIGLQWLKEGDNAVNGVTFNLSRGTVCLLSTTGLGPKLHTDADETPDVIRVEDLRMTVIQRGDRLGVRVKDPNSPVRKNFKGIDYFPPTKEYVISADFVARPSRPKIANVLGMIEEMNSPGIVKFRIGEKDLTLVPVIEDPKYPELFFIFRDLTTGKETYPSGRFLYAEMPKQGKVILNFNRAYNPPCAFTSFSTCPLPPKENLLPVRIEAGEKQWKKSP